MIAGDDIHIARRLIGTVESKAGKLLSLVQAAAIEDDDYAELISLIALIEELLDIASEVASELEGVIEPSGGEQ